MLGPLTAAAKKFWDSGILRHGQGVNLTTVASVENKRTARFNIIWCRNFMVSALVPFGNVGVGLIGSEFGVAFVRLSCQNQCAQQKNSCCVKSKIVFRIVIISIDISNLVERAKCRPRVRTVPNAPTGDLRAKCVNLHTQGARKDGQTLLRWLRQSVPK